MAQSPHYSLLLDSSFHCRASQRFENESLRNPKLEKTSKRRENAGQCTARRKVSLMPLYLCRANIQVYIEKLSYGTNLPFYFSVMSYFASHLLPVYILVKSISNLCSFLHIPLFCSILKHLTVFAQSLIILSVLPSMVFKVCWCTTKGTAPPL